MNEAQPLGMTVHSLPAAGGLPPQQTRSGRWKMLLVMLVCAAPVIASYFTYYVIRPEGRRNYGELIDPIRPMPAHLAVTRLDGSAAQLDVLKDQWLLVTVADAACSTVCQNNLYFQRQLRESLGREKDRLDRVWLITDDAAVPAELLPALQNAQVLRVKPEALATWLQAQPGQGLQDHLFVVDPMGNWMMRFPAAMDADGASKAKRDLDRLLRASASWDDAGRAVEVK